MDKNIILCVDDERMILDSLKSQLRKSVIGNDFDIELSQSASEAFELIEEFHNSQYKNIILISDWLMPEIRGDELLIRVHQLFPNVIKIMLTGQADNNAIQRAKDNANLDIVIYKPWNVEDLILAIQERIK
jgi:CheY-like chemotaxis protein